MAKTNPVIKMPEVMDKNSNQLPGSNTSFSRLIIPIETMRATTILNKTRLVSTFRTFDFNSVVTKNRMKTVINGRMIPLIAWARMMAGMGFIFKNAKNNPDPMTKIHIDL